MKDAKFGNFLRHILRKTASYYDVFGMLSWVLTRPKIFLQKLWHFDMVWDNPISQMSDLYAMWKAIDHDLEDLNKIEIHRWLIPDKFHGQTPLPEISLHGASDASEDAMGMDVWLRWSDGEEDYTDLTFVCARARFTPLKQSSLPRKELQAILLLFRLMSTVRNVTHYRLLQDMDRQYNSYKLAPWSVKVFPLICCSSCRRNNLGLWPFQRHSLRAQWAECNWSSLTRSQSQQHAQSHWWTDVSKGAACFLASYSNQHSDW